MLLDTGARTTDEPAAASVPAWKRGAWAEIEHLKGLARQVGKTEEQIGSTFSGNCPDQLNGQIAALKRLIAA